MMTEKVAYDLHKPGDLAFFRSTTVSSRVNRTAQSISRRAKARFSHVAVCDGSGGFLHADVGSEVCYVYYDELVPADFEGYSAYRHVELNRKILEDLPGFLNATRYFLGQHYIQEIEDRKFIKGSQKFRGKNLDVGETFCSKVVNDIFLRFAPEFAIANEKPLPVDLQKMVGSEGWFEVTQGHKTWFEYLRGDPEMKGTWHSAKRSIQWVRECTIAQDERVDMINSLQRAAAALESLGGRRHPILDQEFEVPDAQVGFWDQRHGRKE